MHRSLKPYFSLDLNFILHHHDATARTDAVGSAGSAVPAAAAAASAVDDDAAAAAAGPTPRRLGPANRASTPAGPGPAVPGPAEPRVRRDPVPLDRGLATLDGGELYPHVLLSNRRGKP